MPFNRRSAANCLGTFVLFLLAACGQPAQQPAVGDAADTDTFSMEKTIQLANLHPYVPASELNCMTTDFFSYFMLGPAGKEQPIPQLPLLFKVGDLKQIMVDACKGVAAPASPGLVVHFGLDASFTFSAAFEVVCLKGDWETDTCTFTPANTYFRINGGQLTSIMASAWEIGHAQRYRDSVLIQHATGEPYTRFIPDSDVRSEVFPYQELLLLIGQNRLTDDDLLELRPTCTSHDVLTGPKETNRRQGVCFVPVGPGVNINDVEDMVNVFKNKAADLGALCPPNCSKAKFEKQGGPRRVGC